MSILLCYVKSFFYIMNMFNIIIKYSYSSLVFDHWLIIKRMFIEKLILKQFKT